MPTSACAMSPMLFASLNPGFFISVLFHSNGLGGRRLVPKDNERQKQSKAKCGSC